MRYFLFIFVFILILPAYSQEDKWQWWNDIHDWHPGMPGWRNFMILSPGYLGPNALPVPEMKRGTLTETSEIQASINRHFHPDDPTQDLSGKLYLPFFEGKVAFEAYGVILENYRYNDSIRDVRFSRDKDGMGLTMGDLYFGFLIQLCKERRFPDTVVRLQTKTASGNAWAARYTDTPGYFFDITSSREIRLSRYTFLRPFASVGFYSWQTYNEATPQNDALLYGAGIDWIERNIRISGYLSGYNGYEKNRDRPMVAVVETRYDWEKTAAGIQFLYGLRDWNYQTFKFSFYWKFPGI